MARELFDWIFSSGGGSFWKQKHRPRQWRARRRGMYLGKRR
jgi:hypothetical protein